jgi:hypothetical protein
MIFLKETLKYDRSLETNRVLVLSRHETEHLSFVFSETRLF